MSEKYQCEREKKLNIDSCRHLSDLLLLMLPEPNRTEHDRCGKKSAVPLLKYKQGCEIPIIFIYLLFF
jgi:hypothetical protein